MFSCGRKLFLAMVGVLVLSIMASPAEAQWGGWWGGDAHHHHDAAGHRVDDAGHHIDQHGHHTGAIGVYDHPQHYTPSYSTPIYSTPSYSTPIYSTPSYSTPTYSAPSNPPYSSYRPPLSDAPAVRYTGEPIRILNPRDSGGSLHYDLNTFHYDISPGQSQTIQSDRAWVISFDRGAGRGDARYALSPGLYEFVQSANGWELYKRSAQSAPPAPPAPTLE